MYLFMFFFLIYALLLSSVLISKNKTSNTMAIILLLFLTLMIGFRYDVGVDYKEYEIWFNEWFDNFNLREPLWGVIIYGIKMLGGEFYLVTLLMAILTNTFLYLGLKKRNINGFYLFLAIFIFSSSYLFISANIMRQSVAISIFFYCSSFIKNRAFWKYTFYIILASGFHISVILLYPLYFIKMKKISIIGYSLMVVSCYILILSPVIPIMINIVATFLPYFGKYANNEAIFNSDVNIFSLGVLLKVIISWLLVLFVQKKQVEDLEFNLYLIGVLMNILSLYTFLIGRIGIYFQVFEILMIPMMLKSVPNKKLRLLLGYFIILSITLFILQIIRGDGNLNLEYKSIFNKD